jgi:hypothetical protein
VCDDPGVIRRRILAVSLAVALAAGGTGAATSSAVAKPRSVHLASPTVSPGAKCAHGVSGCHHGKFTGNFFD